MSDPTQQQASASWGEHDPNGGNGEADVAVVLATVSQTPTQAQAHTPAVQQPKSSSSKSKSKAKPKASASSVATSAAAAPPPTSSRSSSSKRKPTVTKVTYSPPHPSERKKSAGSSNTSSSNNKENKKKRPSSTSSASTNVPDKKKQKQSHASTPPSKGRSNARPSGGSGSNPSRPTPPSNIHLGPKHPTPAALSILSSLEILPLFLSVIHVQLSNQRVGSSSMLGGAASYPRMNWQQVSIEFKLKLMERGWAKEENVYALRQATIADTIQPTPTTAMEERKEALPFDSGNSTVPAASSASSPASASASAFAPASATAPNSASASTYLVRSRRSIHDFTPSVCEALWRMVAYGKDWSPSAAMEMEELAADHRVDEERIRAANLQLYDGGCFQPLPPSAAPSSTSSRSRSASSAPKFHLEQNFGVPPPRPQLFNKGINGDGGDNDDESDVDDSFSAWTGLTTTAGTCAPQSVWRMDGAAISRWIKGHDPHPDVVHLPHDDADDTQLTEQQIDALHLLAGRHALASMLNDVGTSFRVEINGPKKSCMEFNHGEWENFPNIQQGQTLTPAQLNTLRSYLHHAATHSAINWSSPQDDINLLESVLDWIHHQPLPTPESFKNNNSFAALLPITADDWQSIRRICEAYAFSIHFLRRRFWIIVAEYKQHQQQQQQQLQQQQGEQAPTPTATPPNPSFDRICEKMNIVIHTLSKRIREYNQKYQPSHDPATQSPSHSRSHSQSPSQSQSQPSQPQSQPQFQHAQSLQHMADQHPPQQGQVETVQNQVQPPLQAPIAAQ